MPIGSLNVGRDVTVNISYNNRNIVWSNVLSFEAREVMHEVLSQSLNGIVYPVNIPAYWEGAIELDRADSSVDDFFSTYEATYFSGATVPDAIIIETITNPDGSTSQFTYSGVMFRLDQAGEFRENDLVKMRISFRASLRKQNV